MYIAMIIALVAKKGLLSFIIQNKSTRRVLRFIAAGKTYLILRPFDFCRLRCKSDLVTICFNKTAEAN